jgi:hypothetical protein
MVVLDKIERPCHKTCLPDLAKTERTPPPIERRNTNGVFVMSKKSPVLAVAWPRSSIEFMEE